LSLGRLINFHHFPHFDAARGHEGDTLHWDPIKNELKISEKNEEIKAICYRPKRDKGIFVIKKYVLKG
jgi:hypothetical protein